MKALSWEGIDAQQGVAHERAATSLFEICVTCARRVNLVVVRFTAMSYDVTLISFHKLPAHA